MKLLRLLVGSMVVSGCTGVVVATEPGDPRCDGRLEDGEDGVLDSPFDRDGDGYVDGRNADCIATYGGFVLDCDDTDPTMHPDAPEVACNGTDDDCNPDTPDALDHDGDGSIACVDCDDDNAGETPGKPDVCWDTIDNDCDGIVDNNCGPNYNGDFALDQEIKASCVKVGPGIPPLIDVDFEAVSVLWNPPFLSLYSIGSTTPGSLDGDVDKKGNFEVEGSIPISAGACTAKYRWTGQFTGPDTFVTDFETQYSGFLCGKCDDTTWTDIVGTRIGY